MIDNEVKITLYVEPPLDPSVGALKVYQNFDCSIHSSMRECAAAGNAREITTTTCTQEYADFLNKYSSTTLLDTYQDSFRAELYHCIEDE